MTLANVTISDGGADGGGAVENWGQLTVANSTFSSNSAITADGLGGLGGAISNYGVGKLTVANSTFSVNRAGFGGGAIFNGGKLTVTNSSFSDNSSSGDGGAIFSVGRQFTVTNSTFSNNGSDFRGGAIETNTIGATVTNSTFANNRASDAGGAIAHYQKLTATNCTFAKNDSPSGAAIWNGFHAKPKPKLVLRNTIVANSTSGENCSDTAIDKGHNLDSGTSCGFSSAKGSLSNTDPQLDPAGLADNGGLTQTIAVEVDSPAINAGDQRVCRKAPVKNLDQRGFVRPGTGSTNCTIGAYEFNSPGPGAVFMEAE